MLATVSTPGQDLLRLRGGVAAPNIFGIALLSDPKTGRTLRYVLPRSDRPLKDAINKDPSSLHRYEAVMSASAGRLFASKNCARRVQPPALPKARGEWGASDR